MITAHRTHRHFNIDRYLEENKDAAPSNATRFAGLQTEPTPMIRFRGWAIRLNGRIERWMNTLDLDYWKRTDCWLGTLSGMFLTGFVLYMAWIVADAWLQGRFNLGAN
jgi:hypothetical protein